MKNIEKLKERYAKECELEAKHRKNAKDLKKQIELAEGQELRGFINELKLSEKEYITLKKLLKNDRKDFLEMVGTMRDLKMIREETAEAAINAVTDKEITDEN